MLPGGTRIQPVIWSSDKDAACCLMFYVTRFITEWRNLHCKINPSKLDLKTLLSLKNTPAGFHLVPGCGSKSFRLTSYSSSVMYWCRPIITMANLNWGDTHRGYWTLCWKRHTVNIRLNWALRNTPRIRQECSCLSGTFSNSFSWISSMFWILLITSRNDSPCRVRTIGRTTWISPSRTRFSGLWGLEATSPDAKPEFFTDANCAVVQRWRC